MQPVQSKTETGLKTKQKIQQNKTKQTKNPKKVRSCKALSSSNTVQLTLFYTHITVNIYIYKYK